jgi:hypothetical protein
VQQGGVKKSHPGIHSRPKSLSPHHKKHILSAQPVREVSLMKPTNRRGLNDEVPALGAVKVLKIGLHQAVGELPGSSTIIGFI